jgi:hypothetical protein
MKWLRRLIICLFILISCAFLFFYETHRKTVYTTFESPDHKYKIIVYGYHVLVATPGHGDHVPGLACLYDIKSGKELNRCKLGLIQDVDHVEWSATNVWVGIEMNWPLPNN